MNDFNEEAMEEINTLMINLHVEWDVDSTSKEYNVHELGSIKHAVINLIDMLDKGGKIKF